MLALVLLGTPRCALGTPGPKLAPASVERTEPATAGTDSLAAPEVSNAMAALAAFPPSRVRAWQVGFLRADRMQHMGLSFTLTSALIILTRDRGAAAGAAMALALGKELWDQRGSSGFDATDLAAGVTGIGVSVVLVRARGH